MRNVSLILGLAATLLAVGAFALASGRAGPAEAVHGGPDVLGVDMDVTGNTPTTLGTIEDCASVAAGATVTLDFFATNILAPGPAPTDPGGIIGWQANFQYSEAALTLTSEDQNFLLNSNAGSSLLSASEPTPDTDNTDQWLSGSVDTGAGTAESGSGVLSRITIDTTGAAPGQYSIIVDETQGIILDQSGAAFFPHSYSHGAIAVDQACQAIDTPTATPSPSPSPTQGPTEPPTDTPTAGPQTATPTGGAQTTAPPGGATATRTATPAGGTATPARTATPAALPPTGNTDDGNGLAAPLAIGGGTLLALVMAAGGYEITRRLRQEV
jgi:hypothetical protein